jgi:hypothetical protein
MFVIFSASVSGLDLVSTGAFTGAFGAFVGSGLVVSRVDSRVVSGLFSGVVSRVVSGGASDIFSNELSGGSGFSTEFVSSFFVEFATGSVFSDLSLDTNSLFSTFVLGDSLVNEDNIEKIDPEDSFGSGFISLEESGVTGAGVTNSGDG